MFMDLLVSRWVKRDLSLMQWIVAPESTTHRRRLLDDLGRLLRLDRLHDESSLTFMHGGERSGSSGEIRRAPGMGASTS